MTRIDIVPIARAWDKYELGDPVPPKMSDNALADEIELLRWALLWALSRTDVWRRQSNDFAFAWALAQGSACMPSTEEYEALSAYGRKILNGETNEQQF